MVFVVLITTPNLKTARRISQELLRLHLAACINITAPVESHYLWEGKRKKAKEFLLIIKTQKTLFERVVAEVKTLHPYKVPEIIALPIEAGNHSYLKWIELETYAPS